MKKITEKQLIEYAYALNQYTNNIYEDAQSAEHPYPSWLPSSSHQRVTPNDELKLGAQNLKNMQNNALDIANSQIAAPTNQPNAAKTTNDIQHNALDIANSQIAEPTTKSTSAPTDTAGHPNKTSNKFSWQDVYNMNKNIIGSDPNKIRPGQQLKLPNGQTYTVKSGDSLSKIALQHNTASAQHATAQAKPEVQPSWGDDADEQEIQARINKNQAFYNLSPEEQAAANMSLGSTGQIPSTGGQPPSTSPAMNKTNGPTTYGISPEKNTEFNLQKIEEHITFSTDSALARIIQLAQHK